MLISQEDLNKKLSCLQLPTFNEKANGLTNRLPDKMFKDWHHY